MEPRFYHDLRLGVLGGGQLGRMFLRAAIDFNVRIAVLDPNSAAPCRRFCSDFVQGDFKDADNVYDFGKRLDVVTIEIENVSAAGLYRLEEKGVSVYPQARIVELVQDKGLQKQFYHQRGFPTSAFQLVEDRSALAAATPALPAVQKLRRAGYDGRGVQVLADASALKHAFDAPSVLEAKVPIAKELSVITARNAQGAVESYPPVEMAFHPTANLVEHLFAPADIDEKVGRRAREIAEALITELDMVGLLAVELFLTETGELLINEIAPRTHNSGHHTIEANMTSQFEQHLRAVLNLPLGDTRMKSPAVMINILGAEGQRGVPYYKNLEAILAIPGAKLHLYGKAETRPMRKMGHITMLHQDLATARQKAREIQQQLAVEAVD
jgi:5-(carboxyamino)imidazole ribonucleotide synthase